MARLEIHHADGRRVIYEILDAEVAIGSGDGCALRLRAGGIADRHLRLVDDGGRVRVEDLGGGLRVNGDACAAAALAHGDQVDLGDVRLLFLEDGRPRPDGPRDYGVPGRGGAREEVGIVVPPVPRAKRRSSARRRTAQRAADDDAPERRTRRRPRRRGMPGWLIAINLTIVIGILVFLILRALSSADAGRSPEDFVSLARGQWAAGDDREALETLAMAERRGPDAATRSAISTLRERIERSIARQADRTVLAAATARFNELKEFVARYLESPPRERPALREFVRLGDAWLESYAETCRKHAEERALVASVERWMSIYRASAAPEEPDRAEDVLFRAERRLRFRKRRYREAISILEEWLRAHPDAPGAADVQERLTAMHTEGERWVRSRLARIDSMARTSGIEPAIEELEFLIERGGIDAWLGDARKKLAELESRR